MSTALPPIDASVCPCAASRCPCAVSRCPCAPPPPPTAPVQEMHNPYHLCSCYGHNLNLPDYKHDISVPRTLQGHYAKKGGCPCPPDKKAWNGGPEVSRFCPQKSIYCPTSKTKDFLSRKGPHVVHPEKGLDLPREPVSGVRTTFPNRRNYGGRTAASLITGPPLLKKMKHREQQRQERAQDRKLFLEATMQDEILARIDAEEQRANLEKELGLMGSCHVEDYVKAHGVHSLTGTDPRGPQERGLNDFPTVEKQYEEIMEELRFTAQQPLGLKYNIIRLHYLLEEQERLNKLRFQSKMVDRNKVLQKRLEEAKN